MGIKSLTKNMIGWITLQNPQAEEIALKLGLLQGQKEYTRFIILGRSRTGSNFLRGLLNDHPNIITLGEILRNTNEIDWDSPYYRTDTTILNLYQTDPLGFMEKYVFRKFRNNIKAVGFKLFYYHAQNPPLSTVWNALIADTKIHILHIKRENILRTHLSRVQAALSGSWVNTSGKSSSQNPVSIDAEECLKDFEQTRKWEFEFDQLFINHPIMQITYEQLSNNYIPVIQSAQKFLNLPVQPVKPQTHKQSVLSLDKAIVNYWNLKEKFQNTQWAGFFEE
jgi:LPS sulfotransferase NodH